MSVMSTMFATIAVRRGYARWASIAVPVIIGGALMSFLPIENQDK